MTSPFTISGTSGASPVEPSTLIIISCMVWVTGVKILCMRSYRSTDFDVHRNWMAITSSLSLDQWYFDDVNGTTVHTLDYPPAFALFEFFLSTNGVTNWMVENDMLDDRCLSLLPDDDNEPSHSCVFFQRTTVILSDLVLWLGAYILSYADVDKFASTRESIKKSRLTFLLVILNAGLFWLDHIHFQYNGMLLGLLLLSIGLLIRGSKSSGFAYHFNHIMGAVIFALLLTLKHLYLTLAPFYFVYLLREYCTVGGSFSLKRFMTLAMASISTLVLPFLPFLMTNPADQLSQMLSRLFPFVRGLCHDYWAANVWALYMAADKCLRFLFRKLGMHIEGLPMVSPGFTAFLLLVGIIPGLVCAWHNASRSSAGTRAPGLLLVVVFCALTTFMLAYHVHEKAIMTAIIPMTYLASTSEEYARLFLRTCGVGLFGITPLLFRPDELPIKAASYFGFMALVVNVLEKQVGNKLLCKWDYIGVLLLFVVAIFLEVIHPLTLKPHGIFEFLPLMTVSVVCAFGLVGCWFHLGLLMTRANVPVRTLSK